MNTAKTSVEEANTQPIHIRRASADDLARVIALDEQVTGVRKQVYWEDLYERIHTRRAEERFFFVAEATPAGGESALLGFVIGEVRAWEFGSAPCGWVFAISVDPESRLAGVGERLLDTITDAFRGLGVSTMRTMISRDNHLLMSFFRSEGMMAGPYIQLEKELK